MIVAKLRHFMIGGAWRDDVILQLLGCTPLSISYSLYKFSNFVFVGVFGPLFPNPSLRPFPLLPFYSSISFPLSPLPHSSSPSPLPFLSLPNTPHKSALPSSCFPLPHSSSLSLPFPVPSPSLPPLLHSLSSLPLLCTAHSFLIPLAPSPFSPFRFPSLLFSLSAFPSHPSYYST